MNPDINNLKFINDMFSIFSRNFTLKNMPKNYKIIKYYYYIY